MSDDEDVDRQLPAWFRPTVKQPKVSRKAKRIINKSAVGNNTDGQKRQSVSSQSIVKPISIVRPDNREEVNEALNVLKERAEQWREQQEAQRAEISGAVTGLPVDDEWRQYKAALAKVKHSKQSNKLLSNTDDDSSSESRLEPLPDITPPKLPAKVEIQLFMKLVDSSHDVSICLQVHSGKILCMF